MKQMERPKTRVITYNQQAPGFMDSLWAIARGAKNSIFNDPVLDTGENIVVATNGHVLVARRVCVADRVHITTRRQPVDYPDWRAVLRTPPMCDGDRYIGLDSRSLALLVDGLQGGDRSQRIILRIPESPGAPISASWTDARGMAIGSLMRLNRQSPELSEKEEYERVFSAIVGAAE